MKDDRYNQRSVFIAAAVASFLMLILGVGYRAVAARLAAPVNADPITQETLDRLPSQIGEWTGRDTPIDPNVVEETDTDACLSRRYAKDNGSEVISLWIASGVQVRDLMPHRPEVCYTGSGHTLTSQRVVELPLDSERCLLCNVMHFTRHTERVMVLYYYIVDGQYCQDVSQFRYRILDRIGYVTQVQVVTAVRPPGGVEAAEKTAYDFARDSAGPLVDLFKNREEDHPQD